MLVSTSVQAQLKNYTGSVPDALLIHPHPTEFHCAKHTIVEFFVEIKYCRGRPTKNTEKARQWRAARLLVWHAKLTEAIEAADHKGNV